jgi:hypothetical protein
MKTLALILFLTMSCAAQGIPPAVFAYNYDATRRDFLLYIPTVEPPMPSISMDENCMPYQREIEDADGETHLEWIYPENSGVNRMTGRAFQRCVVAI